MIAGTFSREIYSLHGGMSVRVSLAPTLTDGGFTSALTFQACVTSKYTAPPVSCSHRRELFLFNLRASKPTVGLSEEETENQIHKSTFTMEVYKEQDIAFYAAKYRFHCKFLMTLYI